MLGVEIARWHSKRLLWDPLWAPSSGLAMLEGCYKVMKSEDVIVKSEGTLHTSLIDN